MTPNAIGFVIEAHVFQSWKHPPFTTLKKAGGDGEKVEKHEKPKGLRWQSMVGMIGDHSTRLA
jgi:hypothetical protein